MPGQQARRAVSILLRAGMFEVTMPGIRSRWVSMLLFAGGLPACVHSDIDTSPEPYPATWEPNLVVHHEYRSASSALLVYRRREQGDTWYRFRELPGPATSPDVGRR